MKGIPQGRYTREFRQEAVKLVVEDKISCREAALRLSLAPSTLAYWVKAYKEGKLGYLSPVAYAQKYYAGLVLVGRMLWCILLTSDPIYGVVMQIVCNEPRDVG